MRCCFEMSRTRDGAGDELNGGSLGSLPGVLHLLEKVVLLCECWLGREDTGREEEE